MAGLDPNDPLFIRDIDAPEYYADFIKNLQAIAKSTKALQTLIPQEFAKQTRALLDVYKDAGQPSRPKPGPRYKSDSGLTSSTRTNAALRMQLAEQQQRDMFSGGGGARPTDPNEDYGDGRRPQQGHTWQDRVNLGGIADILPLPRYPGAQPNTADLLRYMSTVAANVAAKRAPAVAQKAQQKVYDQWRADNSMAFDADGNPAVPLTAAQQAQLDQATSSAQSRFGGLSDFFTKTESAYAQSQYIKGVISKIARPMTNLTNLGYQTGATSGPAGPLGFRLPWDNSALGQGLAQHWAKTAFMFNNNVSPAQASDIFNQLMTRGWFNGSQTNDMRKAAGEMYNQGYGYVARQPAYYDMMDKATRQGAASLSHFNDVMKQIPGAMQSAHLGIQQVLSDADALGQLNKQMGGTYMGGVQSALEWNNITGQPSDIMASLLQNPLVQGQLFMRSGLMPWEQGLASSGQRMSGIMGALGVLNSALAPQRGLRSQIGNTGFFNAASGGQQKEALMAHILGVSPEVVHTMLTNRQGWMAGANVSDEANAYSTAVRDAIRQGKLGTAGNIFAGVGKGTWGQLKGDLGAALDSQGHHIFSAKDIASVQNIGAGKDIPGHWQTLYPGRGGGVGVRKWIAGQPAKTEAQIAQERANRIQALLAKHNANNTSSGPKLMVELGPAAKKVMHISASPNAQQKAAQNAGAVSIDMNTWASGPTATPFPDLTTAGSGTYDYGSAYDTGNY